MIIAPRINLHETVRIDPEHPRDVQVERGYAGPVIRIDAELNTVLR